MGKQSNEQRRIGPREQRVEAFFREYEAAATSLDPDRVSRHYPADGYVEAGPNGSAVVANDESFREALVQKRRFFRDTLGFRAAQLLVVDQSELSDDYQLATVRWRMEFQPSVSASIDAEFDITYVVRLDETPQIICYVSHQDEGALLRAKGLLP